MPVPVSATNPGGVGLASHTTQELATEGPFARMARMRAEGDATAPGPVADTTAAAGGVTASAVGNSGVNKDDAPAIVVNGLNFSYPGLDGKPIPGVPPVVKNMNLSLPRGSLCLLVGPNGAGKTTLLKVLGGKHMIPESSISVIGRPPFHDTALTMSGDLAYVGGNWDRDIAFAGYSVPLAGDFPAQQMIDAVHGVDPKRKERLIKVMGVNPKWRMHRVSDGQRRRVQICVGLLKEFRVLLLDEITVDLDVLGRASLMRFLREECEQRGATVIYCTHIFDGLEGWPTHLMYVAGGRLTIFDKTENIPELASGKRLMETVLGWLREEKAERKAEERRRIEAGEVPAKKEIGKVLWNNGYSSGTLAASIKLSSNAVIRN